MDISSKVNVKKYFLPVYIVWALIIPTMLILLNAYRLSPPDAGFLDIFDQINWKRVPAMYALYGLVYPITIVTFFGFYKSFTVELGFQSLGEAFKNLNHATDIIAANAAKSITLTLLLIVIWVGPVVHLIASFYFHKKMLQTTLDKNIGWVDYLYGFL